MFLDRICFTLIGAGIGGTIGGLLAKVIIPKKND